MDPHGLYIALRLYALRRWHRGLVARLDATLRRHDLTVDAVGLTPSLGDLLARRAEELPPLGVA